MTQFRVDHQLPCRTTAVQHKISLGSLPKVTGPVPPPGPDLTGASSDHQIPLCNNQHREAPGGAEPTDRRTKFPGRECRTDLARLGGETGTLKAENIKEGERGGKEEEVGIREGVGIKEEGADIKEVEEGRLSNACCIGSVPYERTDVG